MFMNDSKLAMSKAGSILRLVVGIVNVLLFGLLTIMYVTDKVFAADVGIGFLIFCLFFGGMGIWLIVLGSRTRKLLKLYEAYATAISNYPDGFIPDIAAALGTSETVVKKNLELMIKKKYFPNAFLDKNANCMIIGKQHLKRTASYVNMEADDMVTVKCPNCGGVNTLRRGQKRECEYCGSLMKGE